MRSILIVAAHPDDEVLGCGGTVARLVREGNRAYTLILGQGIASRYGSGDKDKTEQEIKKLNKDMFKANRILKIKNVFSYSFPDNGFDTVPLLDIVKVIEKVKRKIKPEIVFTHFRNDLNVDHRIVYEAVTTATRPMNSETVKEIYSFEVPSSTEWNYPITFSPNVFFDVSDTIGIKLKALAEYKSEIRRPPHMRSLEGVRLNAELWGMKVSLKYAEAFENVRSIK